MIQDVSDITSFKWATVTGINPLAIRLDGDTAALALIPDSIIDPLLLALSDRVRVELSLRKVVIHGSSNGGGVSGEVKITAAVSAPNGWLMCQGQSLLRSDYPRLFSSIGTTYGAADSMRFSLPDTRGRTAVGLDTTQSEFDVLGEKGGAKTHTLTVAEMPAHTHNFGQYGTVFSAYYAVPPLSGQTGTTAYNGNFGMQTTGGSGAHNNLQPYIVLNYIIKI